MEPRLRDERLMREGDRVFHAIAVARRCLIRR